MQDDGKRLDGNGLSKAWELIQNKISEECGVRSINAGATNGTISVNTKGVTSTINVVSGLADAAYKNVDTTITSSSTSTNVPTTAAVVALFNSIVDGDNINY